MKEMLSIVLVFLLIGLIVVSGFAGTAEEPVVYEDAAEESEETEENVTTTE